MKTVEMKVADLRPYEKNPRINEQAIPLVAESIRRFGFNVPIVVDRDHVIVTGHTRWRAAQSLGLETVPVIVADHLSAAQARAYRVADNKVAEKSEFDMGLLAVELSAIKASGFDPASLGFASCEIADLMSRLNPADPDEIPEAPPEPITKAGDLWILGDHRLLCGDSTKAADVDRLLGGVLVDMVFMDPPYGHNNNNNGDLAHRIEVALGKGGAQPARPIAQDSPESAALAFSGALAQVVRVLDDGCCCCCCCCGGGGPDPQFGRWSLELDKVIGFKMAVVWDKGGLGLGWHYRRCYEFVLIAQKPGKRPRWFGGDSVPNVIRDIPKIIPRADQHPTEKPVALPAHFIRLHSMPNDLVLDLFGGSGSTMIAAEITSRKSALMELDPVWCDMTVSRWETFTGKKAERQT